MFKPPYKILFKPVRLTYFSTVNTKSGHILAQFAHPMHSDISVISTGLYPFALMLVLERTTMFLGHTVTHSPQPLQASLSIVTFATAFPLYSIKIIFNDTI